MKHPKENRWAAMCLSWILLGLLKAHSSDEPGHGTESGVADFLGRDVPAYKIDGSTLEEALEALRSAASREPGEMVPRIRVVRYEGNPATEANPWRWTQLVTLNLPKSSVPDVLCYLGELTGHVTYADKWRLELFQQPFSRDTKDRVISIENARMLSVTSFRRVKLPTFKANGLTAEEAVEVLRDAVFRKTSRIPPPVGFVQYALENASVTEEPKKQRLSLELKDVPVEQCLRFIAELSGCTVEYHASCAGIYSLVGFYHPKPMHRFRLHELTGVLGKPQKPVAEWLEKALRERGVHVADPVGLNERTGEVFLVISPEGAEALLKLLALKKASK